LERIYLKSKKYETELFGSYSEIFMADSILRSEEFEKMRI